MGEWDEGKHPRGEHGKFGAGDGAKVMQKWAKRTASRKAAKLTGDVLEHGGFTYRPSKSAAGRAPKDGFMVSRDPKEGHGHIIDISELAKAHSGADRKAVVAAIVKKMRPWLEKALSNIKGSPDHYAGGYVERDKKTNTPKAIHLDVSQHFKPHEREKAVSEGRKRNQISIWDVAKGEEIKTGGTGRHHG